MIGGRSADAIRAGYSAPGPPLPGFAGCRDDRPLQAGIGDSKRTNMISRPAHSINREFSINICRDDAAED
jgi:hypothetical protein